MHVREPASFCRENVVAVVILTSCSDNVVMAETNGQMSDVFFILQWEEVLNRLRKKESKMKLSRASIFREYLKKPFFISSNPALAVVLFLESKGTGIYR